MDLTSTDPRAIVASLLHIQARWCARLDSPLYATLLDRAAADAEHGGPVWDVLAGHENDPPGSALALRFMGAVHRLVLEGSAAGLGAFYPSVGGTATTGDAWPAFLAAVAHNVEALRELVDRPVQTNEVGRSAALLGGFLTVARETSLPLRILEVGTSAGLNLRWDHYRYESGTWAWGPATSPVRFTEVFSDRTPAVADAVVAERGGCDTSPVDPSSLEGRLTLLSYTWPDQIRRFHLLRAALDVAARVPVRVDNADGPGWLRAHLANERPGLATIVFHSIVTQYLGEEGRSRLVQVIHDAASRATDDAPLAWLRLEPTDPTGGGRFLVHLSTWPGGGERILAEAHPHGPPVRWLLDG